MKRFILAALAVGALLVLGATQTAVNPKAASYTYELTATDVNSTGYTVIGASGLALSGGGTEQAIQMLGIGQIAEITIESTGGDLVAFKIETHSSPNAPWVTLLENTDFDTATGTMRRCSAEGPHEIETTESAAFIVNFDVTYAFRLSATANNGTASVEAFIAIQGRN